MVFLLSANISADQKSYLCGMTQTIFITEGSEPLYDQSRDLVVFLLLSPKHFFLM